MEPVHCCKHSARRNFHDKIRYVSCHCLNKLVSELHEQKICMGAHYSASYHHHMQIHRERSDDFNILQGGGVGRQTHTQTDIATLRLFNIE